MMMCYFLRCGAVGMLSTALFGTALAHAASVGIYAVRDLGVFSDVAGRSDGRPNAINNQGQIAAANVRSGSYRALLFGGAWTNLGTLGGSESLGSGLNSSSRVVGYSANSGGAQRAFLWTPGGADGVASNPQMKELGTFGGTSSAAFSINTSGQIAGYAQTAKNDHAFRYSGGAMTDIGSLLPNGLPNSYAFSINDLGHIAGTAYNNSYGSWHAFFYNGTTATDLGTFGGQNSSALAINNRGHIAGYYTTGAGYDRAFRYVGGSMTDLGTLGGDYSYALGINHSNVIVGGSFVNASNTVYRAFVCANNSLIDLNTQLDASGTGWTLVEARAINDLGQIVGVGNFAGASHGFLLTPMPKITGVKIKGSDVLVSFTSASGAPYTLLARTNLSSGSWSNQIKGITGNGGIVTATNTGAAALRRQFYRAILSLP
jgi:probable HAF family extracellular repeat protein